MIAAARTPCDSTRAEPTTTYPINVVLTGRRCLVVGGGAVARQKVSGLRRAGATVTVVAPDIDPALLADGEVTCMQRPYQRGEVAGYRLAITCTDDREVNALVAADGEQAGVWVNAADDPANCAFFLPAVARSGPLQIAISTGGASPAMASWLRRKLSAELDQGYAQLLELVVEVRAEARTSFGTSELPAWGDVLDDDLLSAVSAGRLDEARARLRTGLGLS